MNKRARDELQKFAQSIVNVSFVCLVFGMGFLTASIWASIHILQGCMEDECRENFSRLRVFSFYGAAVGATGAIYGIWVGKREGLRRMALMGVICLLGCLVVLSALLFLVTIPERSSHYPFIRSSAMNHSVESTKRTNSLLVAKSSKQSVKNLLTKTPSIGDR